MEPEPQPEPLATTVRQPTFAERNPQAPATGDTLRARLASVGRLDQFEAGQARRRRERDLNPEILTDDVYRARQRLATQRVLNEYLRPETVQPKLTGEGNPNPSMEAMGGRVGRMTQLAPRPIARTAGGGFATVNTEAEVQGMFVRAEKATAKAKEEKLKKGGGKPKQGLKK